MSDLKQRVSAASDAQQGVPTADENRTQQRLQGSYSLGHKGVLKYHYVSNNCKTHKDDGSELTRRIILRGSLKVDADKAPGMLLADAQDGYADLMHKVYEA